MIRVAAAFLFLGCLAGHAIARPPVATPTPLRRAHAHNDYAHTRPLLDALEQGFCSVEADIYLSELGLLIGHLPWEVKAGRTLEKLYLDPLRERARANNNRIYPGQATFYLLIDVKTDAARSYAALATVLERYADILTVTREGKTETKAVTVVISGNCDRNAIRQQKVRYAAIDGRPADQDSDSPPDLLPWISASWRSQFRWMGTGPMPVAERTKLREYVARVHKHHRLVRFWGAPDQPAVWQELLNADVDLINTDHLPELKTFLTEAGKKPRSQN